MKGPNFPLYCKYQLLKYILWHTIQNNAWHDQEGTGQVFVSKINGKSFWPATSFPEFSPREGRREPWERGWATCTRLVWKIVQSSEEQEPQNEQSMQPIAYRLSPVALTYILLSWIWHQSPGLPYRSTNLPERTSCELFCALIFWNLSHFLPNFEFSLIRSLVSLAYFNLHIFYHRQRLFCCYNHKDKLSWSVLHVRLCIMS